MGIERINVPAKLSQEEVAWLERVIALSPRGVSKSSVVAMIVSHQITQSEEGNLSGLPEPLQILLRVQRERREQGSPAGPKSTFSNEAEKKGVA